MSPEAPHALSLSHTAPTYSYRRLSNLQLQTALQPTATDSSPTYSRVLIVLTRIMDQAKIDRPDRPRLSSRCTWSTDTTAGFVRLPCISSVSTAVRKLDIGCPVSPGPHQYKEAICEVCFSRYQAFLCRRCSSLECGPSAPSPSPPLHQESPGVRYPTTPSSSSVSTSFHSDSDRRASHWSSISSQDLDSGEASSSSGVRDAKIKDTSEDTTKRAHALNEKKRRDEEKMQFETAQKTVEDIRGVPLEKCPKNFATKNKILNEIIKCLRFQYRRANWHKKEAKKYQEEGKRYKEERDDYRRALAELQSQVHGHEISIAGCSDDTDTDRVRAMHTDCKRRRTSQQIPTASSGMDGLLKDTSDLDVKPRPNPRLGFRRVSYDRPQNPARQ